VLRAVAVSRAFGGQVVLHQVSVSLDGRDRVGLVGPNGVGKSTLLRLLVGEDQPDEGEVQRRPAGLTVGYLPQEPDARRGETLRDYLARRTGVGPASEELDRRTAALAADPDAIDTYSAALERFLALGGDDFEARAAEVCDRVGLVPADGRATTSSERFGQPTATLSGGEAARAALAAILLSRVDVLLLDEPTNNLDFSGLDQLEAFVEGYPGAVLVTSHDRSFLDRAVHRIVELDGHAHTATEFAGGWSDYVAGRQLARSQQYEAHGRYVSERDRLRQRQRRQEGWSERGVRRAKTSGEPDKNLRHARAERSEKQTGKIRATERKLEQLERSGRVDKPWEGWELRLSLAPEARSGDVVARLDGAVVVRGEGDGAFRLGPVDLEVRWQDRLAVVGPNGAGKSTLLAALLGEEPLAEGRRWVGPGVRVGELDQRRSRFAGEATVLATFQAATGLDRSEARSLLAKFSLGADHVGRAGRDLSPGERSRASLAALTAAGVNCLVLDEPTNHLDIEAIEQLEHALVGYDGTLVVVSHDRRFLEHLDLTRQVVLSAGVLSG
jgi:ATPase subunit of ABC transporter with duplicated ATPase domains